MKVRAQFLSVLLFASIAALVAQKPLSDVDLFTQLRLGLLAVERHAVVTTDPFTFTHYGEPFPAAGWLGQLLFAASFICGGLRSIVALHSALLAGAFVIASLWARRVLLRHGIALTGTAYLAGASTAFLVGASNMSARPQSVAIFCFAIFLYALEWPRSWIRDLAIVLMLVAWQNIHSSVVLAAVASLAMLPGLLQRSGTRDRAAQARGSRAAILLVTALAAQLATPLGTEIFAFSAVNTQLSRELLGISEWLPPWSAAVRVQMIAFFAALPLFFLGIAHAPRDPLILSAGFLLLSFYAARFGIFWGIASMPLFMLAFLRLPVRGIFALSAEEALPLRRYRQAFLALIIPIGIIALLPEGRLVHRDIPLGCTKQLIAAVPSGRIFNYREWGGPLSFFGPREMQIMIDGRIYLYSVEEWQAYAAAARGERSLADLESRYHPDGFLLRKSFFEPLIGELRQSAHWRIVADEGQCIAFAKVDVAKVDVASAEAASPAASAVNTAQRRYP